MSGRARCRVIGSVIGRVTGRVTHSVWPLVCDTTQNQTQRVTLNIIEHITVAYRLHRFAESYLTLSGEVPTFYKSDTNAIQYNG